MKILVCDKTEAEAIERMRAAGLQVDVRDDITPEELFNVLPAYDGMVVRSRTKVRQPLIDAAPNLKVIVRGGVGLDTIDAEYRALEGHDGNEYAEGQQRFGGRAGDRLYVRPGALDLRRYGLDEGRQMGKEEIRRR